MLARAHPNLLPECVHARMVACHELVACVWACAPWPREWNRHFGVLPNGLCVFYARAHREIRRPFGLVAGPEAPT